MGVAANIKLNNFNDLFGSEDTITEVSISKLHDFNNHPFKVIDDEHMAELIDSIKEQGVLVPATVRPLDNGDYELISGHRRKHACEMLGIKKMPVIIRDLSDDEAAIIMVDSNIQREELLPSEKAFAYRMKLEAIKNQKNRPKKITSIETVAAEAGESRANIQRYIRLTYLTNELLELVDIKKMPLNVGVGLSYLSTIDQNTVFDVIESIQSVPSLVQVKEIEELSQVNNISFENVFKLMTRLPEKEQPIVIKFKPKIKDYFPNNYTPKQIEESIIQLLEAHYKK